MILSKTPTPHPRLNTARRQLVLALQISHQQKDCSRQIFPAAVAICDVPSFGSITTAVCHQILAELSICLVTRVFVLF